MADSIVDTVYELQSLFREHQQTYLPVSPPSEDVFVQKHGLAVPFRTDRLPKKFLKRLVGELDQNLIPLYRISIYEDPVSRDTVFINSLGQRLYQLEAEEDYDPFVWQSDRCNMRLSGSLDSQTAWILDPAHIAADFTLVPETFYESYLHYEEQNTLMAVESVPMMRAMSVPGEGTNKTVDISVNASGQVELNAVLPVPFGRHAEIFRSDGLAYPSKWTVAANRISLNGSPYLTWTDVDSDTSTMGFYIISDADADADGDGYSDHREYYVTKMDPTVFNWVDSDLDGMHDWYEIMLFGNITNQSGSDDFDGDSMQNTSEMVLTATNVIFHSDPSLFDTDADGIDDAYETSHSFLNPFDPADAQKDWDLDGTSNRGEYFNKTDPADSQDGGDTNVMTAVTLTVGDYSGQYGYYYKMTLTYSNQEVSVSNNMQGESVTRTVLLRKGTTYSVRLKRTWPPGGCGIIRDYIATIEGANVVIPESADFLGEHQESDAVINSYFDRDDIAVGSVHIIKVESVEFKGEAETGYEELTEQTLLLKGQVLDFRAIVSPDIDPFPAASVQWSGTFGVSGTGKALSHLYTGNASSSDTDYRTVIVCDKSIKVVVADKVLGIHSNADPGGGIGQPMHAWISVTDYNDFPADLTTYGLWHYSVGPPAFARYEPDTDLYVDLERDYTPNSHNRYYLLLPSEYDAFVDWLDAGHDFKWSGSVIPPTYDCASFASDTIAEVVGEDVDADDILGFETPREISQSIDHLEAADPTMVDNPALIGTGSSGGGSSWIWP